VAGWNFGSIHGTMAPEEARTPLMAAARRPREKMVKVQLAKGNSVQQKSLPNLTGVPHAKSVRLKDTAVINVNDNCGAAGMENLTSLPIECKQKSY
jgi:hypothetical protein